MIIQHELRKTEMKTSNLFRCFSIGVWFRIRIRVCIVEFDFRKWIITSLKFVNPVSSELVATGGCTEIESMTDRFSSLPFDVAHCILSFLDIQNLTRFGCVSKRCNQLYLTSPWLDFNLSPDYVYASTCEKRLRLLNSLDRFLFIRRGNNKIHHKIHRFRVYWSEHNVTGCHCRDELFRMFSWVENTVRCKVEELHLVALIEKDVDNSPIVPSSVLLSGSLRTRLSFSETFPLTLRTPATFSSNIEWLDLEFVNVDEGFFNWISSSCKCIKHLGLTISNHIQNITLQSSSLESFEYDCTPSGYLGKTNLNILSLKLKRMKLFGCSLGDQNLHTLTCIEEFSYTSKEEDEYEIVYEVLRSVCSVKHLELDGSVIMVLLKGCLMPALPGVRHFELDTECFDDALVPGLVSVFPGMPYLSTVIIRSYQEHAVGCSKYKRGYWKEQNLAFIHKVEDVAVDLCNGSNAIEFARYVLEHAENLKIMRIYHSPEESEAIKKVKRSKKVSNARVEISIKASIY